LAGLVFNLRGWHVETSVSGLCIVDGKKLLLR